MSAIPKPPRDEAGHGYFILRDGACIEVGGSSGHAGWIAEHGHEVPLLEHPRSCHTDSMDAFLAMTGIIRVRHCYTEHFFDPATHEQCSRRDVIFTIPDEEPETLRICQMDFEATYRDHDRERISPKDVWKHQINIGVASLLTERYAWRQGAPTNWLWFVTELNQPDSETRGRLTRLE